jgi:heterodisulfide reductase subunit C
MRDNDVWEILTRAVESPQSRCGDTVSRRAFYMSDRPVFGQRLKEFQQREVERILGACTQCGKCFEVCPMAQYSKAPATDGKAVVPGVLAVLRGDAGSPEALGWIGVCTRSGVCVPACPKNVDPKMMMRLARMTALGGRGLPKQIETKEDRDYFDRVRAFAKLQLTDDELKEWT